MWNVLIVWYAWNWVFAAPSLLFADRCLQRLSTVLKSDFFRKRVLFQWKIAFTIINYRMKYLNCMSYLIF
jgi:hypothetical protein